MLSNRDYTLIIDKSGSMATKDQPGGKSRWEAIKESTMAVASRCEELDPDGITVYLFAGKFKRYDKVTSAKVEQIFQENEPAGSTNLTAVLRDALDHHFSKPDKRPTTILVVTDGEPDDRKSVFEVIIQATQRMTSDEELAISFLQIGNDPQATQFLKSLDDKLTGVGAKFDVVDTVTFADMEDMTITEVLTNAIAD
ncbi:MAG: VWA domain-containing protein [Pseudanabaenaceae cyanobacterium SKYGB_i_bin29]|nr:VWA domain-containing protein [Pseudanabaenaceae cyanobacterium SKYG29]MDW8421372.1 VWA domain-containing protein [Pseudanabaenaceae cyanobacterium SKYGB_i_bin29]